jgi:hypothetical protein
MSGRSTIKTADAKGRVVLGRAFANSTLIVTEVDPTEVTITKAKAIPERELWLLEHPKALRGVLEGLRQADRGQFDENPPDYEADLKAARKALKEAGFDADA